MTSSRMFRGFVSDLVYRPVTDAHLSADAIPNLLSLKGTNSFRSQSTRAAIDQQANCQRHYARTTDFTLGDQGQLIMQIDLFLNLALVTVMTHVTAIAFEFAGAAAVWTGKLKI